MDIKELLKNCHIEQSYLTKTGVFYRHNGRIVLEYIKSSKNVWVDDETSNLIPMEERAKCEADIRSFLGNVKNVTFNFGLNKYEDDAKETIKKIFNQMMEEKNK